MGWEMDYNVVCVEVGRLFDNRAVMSVDVLGEAYWGRRLAGG